MRVDVLLFFFMIFCFIATYFFFQLKIKITVVSHHGNITIYFCFVLYAMHVHKMYQTTLIQTLFSFALTSNSFLMLVFSFSRKPVSVMCD